MAWTTRATRTVYENPWIHVREDEVTGPHGDGIYGVVSMQNPAVFVVALDDEERGGLVGLERYTNRRSHQKNPGGADGPDSHVAAQRELLEEAGVTASEWHDLGTMNALNGIAEAPEHVFLARGLSMTDATHSQHEEGIDAVLVVLRAVGCELPVELLVLDDGWRDDRLRA